MLLRVIGRLFIGTGVLILLFLAYQLWGTDFVTGKHQDDVAAQLDKAIAAGSTNPEEPKPDLGQGVMRIEIPKINLNWVVVEGVGVEDLKKGPGHFPGTAFPGQGGNVVISGHRATYGEPFAHMDQVENGDIVKLTSADGVFQYKVIEKKIVQPDDLSVVVELPYERLTLTTCHPRYSSKLRMIVFAEPLKAVSDL